MKHKKILIVFVFIFVYLLNVSNVYATHECEYSYKKDSKDADVKIIYEDEEKVSVESPGTNNIWKNIAEIVSVYGVDYRKLDSSSPLLTETIGRALSEDSCPGEKDEVYVCGGISTSIEPLSIVSTPLEAVTALLSWIWEKNSFLDYVEEYVKGWGGAFGIIDIKEILIVSGSQRDAEQSYGYKETGWLKVNWDGFYKLKEDFDVSLYTWSTLECKTAYYIGDKKTFDLNCPYLSSQYEDFETSISAYKNCGDDYKCKVTNLSKIDEKEGTLKSYCEQIIANQDYYLTDKDQEEEKVNSCLTSCLEIKSRINQTKKDAGLLSTESGECGFSERLGNWILNIFRWIKYILPVLVIILGILDFIKAIGSDKEDEMKKAQKKFIIRLIAAALVFIVPLVIEFVLDKIGFGYNNCGLF